MNTARSITTPVNMFALLMLSAGVVLVAIGWLGWRLLAQERALEEQRLRDQLENTATVAVRELERAIVAWEDRLPAVASASDVSLPPGSAAIVFDEGGVVKRVGGVGLPYVPHVHSSPEASVDIFAAAETLEFARGDLPAAERFYRQLATSADPSIKAAALMRLARTLRHQQRLRDALSVYGELASLGPSVWVAGSPAELVARRERIALFEALNDSPNQERETGELAERVRAGHYQIDRATFDFYAEAIPHDGAQTLGASLADKLDELWPTVQKQASGRAAASDEHGSVLAVWRQVGSSSALILGEMSAMFPPLSGLTLPGFTLTLEDASGKAVWGVPATTTGAGLLRTARQTSLPWTVRVAATDTSAAETVRRSRQWLFIVGFILAALVVTSAGVAMFRAVNHELNVARLQSEFVATVSHEFRTPLTAMRHLTEMLDEGQTSPERVPQYYRALVKETRRLQSLVESLLDFGRMEAGRRTYRMEKMNVADLVGEVIDGFPESTAAGRIKVDSGSVAADGLVRVDREAIGLALRNLIDNALKYSPESARVRVSAGRDGAHVVISVADEGPGIATSEQREIFRKFVRGSAAADRRVKGTGIGLAMADHIVRAHGGQVHVHSAVGRGSVFTIALPVSVAASGHEGVGHHAESPKSKAQSLA